MDGRNDCACVCVGRGQLLTQPQLFTHFDLGKPEESFLASSLLMPSRSRTGVMLWQAEPSPSFMPSGFSPGAHEEVSGEQHSQLDCNSKMCQLIAILSQIPV